jgi:hypothetical protein
MSGRLTSKGINLPQQAAKRPQSKPEALPPATQIRSSSAPACSFMVVRGQFTEDDLRFCGFAGFAHQMDYGNPPSQQGGSIMSWACRVCLKVRHFIA